MNTISPKDEKAPVAENNLAEILIDRSIDAIIAMNKNYEVITWNKAAVIMYGVSKNHALGKSFFDLIPSIKNDHETMRAIQNTLLGNSNFIPASKQFINREQTENHYIPIYDNNWGVTGIMNIVHDVAHRIKAERRLQQMNDELEKSYRRLKVTSDEMASYTYITSNKIKEPIRQVYTGIEHLIHTEASRLTDSGKASFRRIQASLNRMDLLLDDILSIAQISILQKTNTSVNLDEVVTEIGTMIKKKSEKEVDIQTDKLGTINGHGQYLHLLFYNLLDNAVKFNENNKVVIKITCENSYMNDGLSNAFSEIKFHKVSVHDNGIGIDGKDKERIFRMFEKVHDKLYKGSGMGLALVQKIMNAHGGFIEVESEPGKGSIFNCFFPVNEE